MHYSSCCSTRLLLLLDSRAPADAQHHSGRTEAEVIAGLVTDLTGAEDFCRTRLRTSGRVAAAFATACYSRMGRVLRPRGRVRRENAIGGGQKGDASARQRADTAGSFGTSWSGFGPGLTSHHPLALGRSAWPTATRNWRRAEQPPSRCLPTRHPPCTCCPATWAARRLGGLCNRARD
jgi:hypothetical protein